MNRPLPRLIAISAALVAASLGISLAFAAEPPARVVRLDGPLLAQGIDGRVRALSGGSAVQPADTVSSGDDAYAEISLAGGGSVTLRPQSRMKIEGRELTLIRGGVRVASGRMLVRLACEDGSVDIRDAVAVIEYRPREAGAVARSAPIRLASLAMPVSDALVAPLLIAQMPPPAPRPGLPAGLYVHVIDGLINLTNKGGSLSFSAGQFGYVPSHLSPPVVVPINPGIRFTPPPAFSRPPTGTGSNTGQGAAVDCEVR